MNVSKLMVCAMLAAAAVPTIQAGSLSKEPSQSAEDYTIFREDLMTASAGDFAKWTVIDANEDSTTWTFEETLAASYYKRSRDGDDWLISPEITIPRTGSYRMKFYYSGDKATKDGLEVYYGNGNTVESMKNKPEIDWQVYYEEDVWSAFYSGSFIAEFNEGEKVNLGLHEVKLFSDAAVIIYYVEMTFFPGTPVKLWNFEDGQMPADLVFKAEDEGTVNPGAGTYWGMEFNEEGWGIYDMEGTSPRGFFQLFGTSWIDGADSADRWMIFPKVHVNSENAHFAWESVNYSPDMNYEVKVSESTDSPADFSTVLSVHDDNTSMGLSNTHDISLGGYNGKDIYVAINLRTAAKARGFLALDNLGFYGGIDEVPTGTEAIRPSETEEGFTIGEDCIKANGKDVKGIEIFTMSGAKVLQTEKPVLSTAALKPGIYIVRVRTSERAYTGKFAK